MNNKNPAKENFIKHIFHNIKEDTDLGFNGKKIRLLALIVTIFMLVFVIYYRGLFLDDFEFTYGPLVFAFALLAAPTAGILIATHCRTSGHWKGWFNSILFFLMPIATMQLMECYNGKFVYNFSIPTFLLNYTAYIFVYLVCLLISGRFHMSVLIVNIGMYVAGMINYFVDLFRGTPVVPLDITTIKTGMEVADGYTYEMSWNLIMASIVLFLIYLVNKRIVNVKPPKFRLKVLEKILIAAFIASTFITLMFTDFLPNRNYKPDFWNQDRGYHKTGTWLNFCMNLRYLHVSKPEGYDASKVEDIIDTKLEEYGVDPDSDTSLNILTGEDDYTPSDTQPNIICIMNESWADLGSTIGNLETNEDYMPFIHNLTKNTIKGTTQVPVFGAGTSNSEYEFLTGNSIQFLPQGCNVYQLYVKNFVPSITSTLGAQGYSKYAYHPYYASGWNRINVYNNMGFDSFTSIEDFIDEDILETYKKNNDAYQYEQMLKLRYPERDMLLRRFVSDSYDYQMVEEMYENRDTSKPFYLFNVTMQNHGGYAMSYDNFDDQEIYATNTTQEYEQANRYLSLVKHTDSAFKELVTYFKNVDEPTIICMFGDHQPSIEDAFYEELYKTDLNDLSIEQQQQRYTTPFVIWANYDIPEEQLDKISTNYLSTIVMQLAGVEITQYQKYLACLYQEIPVMDSVGYITSDGEYYSYDDQTDYTQDINDYQCIEYNSLIDKKNRQIQLFTLDGQETTTVAKDPDSVE